MKLASIENGSRDGALVVVSKDLRRCTDATAVARTMQAAIEDWDRVHPLLEELSRSVAEARVATSAFASAPLLAPFPRAYQWLDGSAFLNHGRLLEKAFNSTHANEYERYPLVYQGGSDDFLGAHADIRLPSEADGIDFEGEIAVVLDDVPLGATPAQIEPHIKLLMLVNDVSCRALGPREMQTGFGFVQAKPSSAFSPVAVTPDELGADWRHGRLHRPLSVRWNSAWFGHPDASEMSFDFFEIVAHAARTRRLRAGTIVGSGTVSNADRSAGCACISERRAIEMIEHGTARTGYMRFGDRVRIEMLDREGNSIFGAIDQQLVAAALP